MGWIHNDSYSGKESHVAPHLNNIFTVLFVRVEWGKFEGFNGADENTRKVSLPPVKT